MKGFYCVLFILGLLPTYSYAQTTSADTIHYQRVVAVAGVSAADLYARAREWAALTFEDVHQAVQLDDPQRHLLMGGGYTELVARRTKGRVRAATTLWFRFRIETREGRYRVEIYQLGALYPFSSTTNLTYAPYEWNRWMLAGYATQAASERHQLLSNGFPAISLYPIGATADQFKPALDEAVDVLLRSLYQTETAVPATW